MSKPPQQEINVSGGPVNSIMSTLGAGGMGKPVAAGPGGDFDAFLKSFGIPPQAMDEATYKQILAMYMSQHAQTMDRQNSIGNMFRGGQNYSPYIGVSHRRG